MSTTSAPVDLDTMPARMRKLAVDARGYPVPWFVAWIERFAVRELEKQVERVVRLLPAEATS